MAREEFIDNVRTASRYLFPPTAEQGDPAAVLYASPLYRADLWFSPTSVEAFSSSDWPASIRTELSHAIAAFRSTVKKVPVGGRQTKGVKKDARKHLERVVHLVREQLLHEWLHAQNEVIEEAKEAAKEKGWFYEEGEKEMHETLLGKYKAPRLYIRVSEKGFALRPVARFGSGKRGLVDLVALPNFDRKYVVALVQGDWSIFPVGSVRQGRPFNRATFAKTLAKLSGE